MGVNNFLQHNLCSYPLVVQKLSGGSPRGFQVWALLNTNTMFGMRSCFAFREKQQFALLLCFSLWFGMSFEQFNSFSIFLCSLLFYCMTLFSVNQWKATKERIKEFDLPICSVSYLVASHAALKLSSPQVRECSTRCMPWFALLVTACSPSIVSFADECLVDSFTHWNQPFCQTTIVVPSELASRRRRTVQCRSWRRR